MLKEKEERLVNGFGKIGERKGFGAIAEKFGVNKGVREEIEKRGAKSL
jgi:hypothetical protein